MIETNDGICWTMIETNDGIY